MTLASLGPARVHAARALWLASLAFATSSLAAPPPLQPASGPDTSGPELTLHALMSYAEAHAPLIALDAANDARVRAARAAAGRALPSNPDLWVGLGPRFEAGKTGLDFEVGVSQRVEVGGERQARLRVAAAVERRIAAESTDRRWDLHTTVHALYYQAVVARERAALARRVVAFQEEIATIVGKQRAAGQVSQLAERLALAETANARQALAALEQEDLAVRQDLALVIGWSPEVPPRPRGDLDALVTLPPLGDLVALAAVKRPDLALLDATLDEARLRVAAADKDRTPEPVFGLSWARESSPLGTAGDASHVVMATVALPLPFFDNNDPARASARAELEVAQAERRKVGARIAAEVTRAYRAAVAATQRLDAFGREVLPRFEENLAALKRAYALGEIDIFGLASGRERFLSAQRDALTAQHDYFTALAELEHAVGVDVIDAHHDDPATDPHAPSAAPSTAPTTAPQAEEPTR